MNIRVVITSNQLFKAGSYDETKFKKIKVVTCKTLFFVIGPFCTHHSVCLNIGLTLKMLKTSSDCYIKTCRSLKRRAILKIPRTYALSVGFKMKPLRKSVF